MGWTEQQALSSDVNAVLVAHEGRLGMFETAGWIERVKKPEKGKEPDSDFTEADFDKLFPD